jgi:hypothetical protein
MNFPESQDQNLSVFFYQFCDIAKVAIISHEDLLKFGNNQDMEVKIISASFDIFGYLLEPCTEEIWRFFFIYL